MLCPIYILLYEVLFEAQANLEYSASLKFWCYY